jgi:CRISPR-associated protein Cas1
MRRLLNTLFVTTQGAYLSKEGESVVVRAEGVVRSRIPLLGLEGIVCFGQVGVSPALMALCCQRGVAISFLSRHGRFLGRVVGPVSGNVLLRREQYRQADREETALGAARAVVGAKIVSARAVLLRALRDHADTVPHEALQGAAVRLQQLLAELERAGGLETCRGIEGAAAQAYFGVFDGLIVQQKEAFHFAGRTRRPPLDGVNSLLSFVYTLLVHDIRGSLEGVGLDPAVGFLHRDRPGRPGLALDLLEEFRPWLADRLVLSLINLKQVSAGDLELSESGGVHLTEAGRRTVLVAYQKRKRDEVIHPFLRERVAVGLLPHVQALLLARHLRGDLDGYPPFVWK